jgi:hypothetical protein
MDGAFANCSIDPIVATWAMDPLPSTHQFHCVSLLVYPVYSNRVLVTRNG